MAEVLTNSKYAYFAYFEEQVVKVYSIRGEYKKYVSVRVLGVPWVLNVDAKKLQKIPKEELACMNLLEF